jgi:DNA-binding CsgD family transcriptional regulator
VREILTWVARALAPGTVGKHLDNVYAKLGVGNRAAAVARTFLGFAGDS